MKDVIEKNNSSSDWSLAMKRDWDDRARGDAKWFINTRRLAQPEEEFDADGARDVHELIVSDLELLTQGRDPKELKVLELGCGIGRMTKSLASIFGEVHSTDVSGEMIRTARDRLKGLNTVTFYETSGYDLAPLPDNYFDFAFSAFVFRHVPTTEIIEENLREAYRVLKPGGVMRFHTNSITVFDFEDSDKDTWIGASYSDALIRRFGNNVGAQIISIYGVGKKDCWTTLRKPVSANEPDTAQSSLKIEDYGQAGDLSNKSIAVSGDDAALALVVSGLSPSSMCCNSVTIEIAGMPIAPRFVGASAISGNEGLVAVEADVPFATPAGDLAVRVRSSSLVSSPVHINFVKPGPVIPEIVAAVNAVDGGTDVFAQGPKSRLRLIADGLDRTADPGNVRIKIADRIVRPATVALNASTSRYEVDVQIPPDTHPGAAAVVLYFGNLASPAVKVGLLPALSD